MELEAARIPTVIAAFGMFALAAWILLLRPNDRLHRALSVFLLFRGLMEGLAAFQTTGPDIIGPLLVYSILALPFAALNLAIVFHDRYRDAPVRIRGGNRLARSGVLLAAIVVEGAYFFDHALWFDAGPGTLSLFLQITPLSFISIALVFGLRSVRRWTQTTRHALALFAVGFAWQPAYDVTYFLLSGLWYGIGPTWLDVVSISLEFVSFGAFVALVVALAAAGMHRYAFATVIPAVTAIPVLLLTIARSPYGFATATTMAAVWHLGLVALVGYAVLKFQLFDIDLRVKSAVRNGAVTAGIAAVFFVVSELLEQTVPGDYGLLAGLAIAAAIALALRPILNLARRLAERVLPGVEDSQSYRMDRSRALYMAAVEGAYQDEEVTARERLMLDRLRLELGLDEMQAQLIEAQVTVRTRERRRAGSTVLSEDTAAPSGAKCAGPVGSLADRGAVADAAGKVSE